MTFTSLHYDYTVEVTNTFKGLEGPEELRREVHNIVLDVVIKTIPKTKTCKKVKWFSEEA